MVNFMILLSWELIGAWVGWVIGCEGNEPRAVHEVVVERSRK